MTLQMVPTERELIALVDGLRGFVVDRMRGYRGEVDATMQVIRETVWRNADRFDGHRGRPEDFVFGVARNVVRHELAKLARQPRTTALEAAETASATNAARSMDPLTVLGSRQEHARWVQLLADATSEDEWGVVVELAVSGESPEKAADRLGLPPRLVRAIRERVTLVGLTVRAASAAAEREDCVSLAVLARCIPDRGGLREVLPYLGAPTEAAAAALSVAASTFRNRRALARRLLNLAVAIIGADRITQE